ncbi:MAG TPA: porin [Sutterella sp.]|nr:porin [Sutterella sp.]
MRKSLLAVAVLGAFAGSAMATDVTLYGVVDTGLVYTHSKVKYDGGDSEKKNTFQMKSGNQAGSRWGLKGVEDLGNGYKVGFILESGFDSDTGKGKSQFFNRESSLFVDGGFGRILFGRMGSVNQGTSSTGKIGMISAFGTSYGDFANNAVGVFMAGKSLPNMITYQSPKFAGVQIHAQYAMSDDSGDGASENKARKTNRYAALAATYNYGALNLYGAVDATDYEHEAHSKHHTASTYTLGGNYDFGVLKLFGGVQYFDEVYAGNFKGAFKDEGIFGEYDRVKGWGVQLSASMPVAGGTLLAGVGYMDGKKAKSDEEYYSKNDISRIRATVGYSYPLSKRTNVYAAAGFGKDENKYTFKGDSGTTKNKVDYATAFVGLRHNF